MAGRTPVGTWRERLILWVWRRLPLNGRQRLILAWALHVRYAVAVSGVIRNEAGEVLVLQHTYRRVEYAWGLPGGWVKGREQMERALAREVWEETGFTIAIERVLSVQSGFSLPRLTVVFLARLVEGTFRPSAEVSAYRFCTPETLPRMLLAERQLVLQAASTTREPS